jgi:C-terminal processing protease CtpA/Prc
VDSQRSAKSANTEGGIKLFAKNKREILVDTVQVSFTRKVEAGLGILLQEVAGGRDDGSGITLVSSILEDGPAANSGILTGDSIIKVTVVKRQKVEGTGMTDVETQVSVATECLGYDGTVEAIRSLPPAQTDDETLVITVKRLRRKPKVRVLKFNTRHPKMRLTQLWKSSAVKSYDKPCLYEESNSMIRW